MKDIKFVKNKMTNKKTEEEKYERIVEWRGGSLFGRISYICTFGLMVLIIIHLWYPYVDDTFFRTLWTIVLILVFLFAQSKDSLSDRGERKIYWRKIK